MSKQAAELMGAPLSGLVIGYALGFSPIRWGVLSLGIWIIALLLGLSSEED
jgi:hypothetical protein